MFCAEGMGVTSSQAFVLALEDFQKSYSRLPDPSTMDILLTSFYIPDESREMYNVLIVER